ncbi:hypothetical protein HW260_02845 [Helicobacter cinaedi]|nr:T6SS effector amidase Tae4 family protein [Helicobacter cinaedi]QOQ91832.1 hypothetical protein HW260_02845 [Helicobacter cinaedi]QOQ97205.1 hypothetical protein HW245_07475 [Helicobacter cinaedi]
MRDFLYVKWGFEKPYNPKEMYSKNDNIAFRQELQNFKKNGIVVMQVSGWGNAYGHTTLWSGDEQRFIGGTDYLIDGGTNVVVTKFYFWTLDNEKNNISNIAIV